MQAVIKNQTARLDAACSLIRRSGGERAIELSASPIHDKNEGVIGAVMVAHDVTVARDLSAKLARLALGSVNKGNQLRARATIKSHAVA